MKNLKILKVLSSLSNKELREFEKFISSTYYNEGRNYLPLIKILKKYHPEFDHPKLTQEFIFKKAFNGKNFNRKVLLNRMSKVNIILEEYLIQKAVDEDKLKRKLLLAKSLLKRGNIEYYKTVSANIGKEIKSLPADKSLLMEKELLKLNAEYYYSNSDFYNAGNCIEKLTLYNFLTDFIVLMDCNHDSHNYKHYFDYKNELGVVNDVLNAGHIESTFAKIAEYDFPHKDLFTLLFNCYKLGVNTADDSIFHATKKYFYRFYKSISKELLYKVYANLNEYCTKKINQGFGGFVKHKFEICKFFVGSGLFSEHYNLSANNKYLDAVQFINTVQTGILAKELDWAESFIVLYSKYLMPEEKEAVYDFCYAKIYASRGDFVKALESVKRVKMNSDYYNVETKVLYLKILFMLNNYVESSNVVESIRHILKKRNVISENRKERYGEFVKYYNMVFELKLTFNVKTYKLLNKEISEKSNMPGSLLGWLLNRLEEIKSVYS